MVIYNLRIRKSSYQTSVADLQTGIMAGQNVSILLHFYVRQDLAFQQPLVFEFMKVTCLSDCFHGIIAHLSLTDSYDKCQGYI